MRLDRVLVVTDDAARLELGEEVLHHVGVGVSAERLDPVAADQLLRSAPGARRQRLVDVDDLAVDRGDGGEQIDGVEHVAETLLGGAHRVVDVLALGDVVDDALVAAVGQRCGGHPYPAHPAVGAGDAVLGVEPARRVGGALPGVHYGIAVFGVDELRHAGHVELVQGDAEDLECAGIGVAGVAHRVDLEDADRRVVGQHPEAPLADAQGLLGLATVGDVGDGALVSDQAAVAVPHRHRPRLDPAQLAIGAHEAVCQLDLPRMGAGRLPRLQHPLAVVLVDRG